MPFLFILELRVNKTTAVGGLTMKKLHRVKNACGQKVTNSSYWYILCKALDIQWCIGIIIFLISFYCVYLDCEWCTETDTNLFGEPNGVDMSGFVKGCVKKGTCPKQKVKNRSVKIILILYFNDFTYFNQYVMI